MDSVKIVVPSSTANLGPGFDVVALGFENPKLDVTATRIPKGIEVEVKSPYLPPKGRTLGYAGRMAAEYFLRKHGISEGLRLLFESSDYPPGGLGLSGAEIAGTMISGAVVYERELRRDDTIKDSGDVEGHFDNVAASVNANINAIAPHLYPTNDPFVYCFAPPENLGVVMGFSSYKKEGGTEASREAMKGDLRLSEAVDQSGLAVATFVTLAEGDTDKFLELAWRDRLHELRRARKRCYGDFDDVEFFCLKEQLYKDFHVAWVASGAGNSMLGFYNKDEHPDGIVKAISPAVVPWNRERGIIMDLKEMRIAKEGAYDYAHRVYGF